MKKIFNLLLVALVPAATLMAQTEKLPDGSFEEWTTGTNYSNEKYDDLKNSFWTTLNVLSTLSPEMGTGPIVVFKEEGKSGFCPKMMSSELTLGEQPIFLPGVVGAMTVIIDKQTANFGRPFTSRPQSLKGFMKYEPVDGDSASIFVEVYKSDAEGRRIIGKVEKKFKEAIEDWTEFELNLRYQSDEVPDSISVLFVSSAGYNFDDLFACKGSIGSTLWVDECEFTYDMANEDGSFAIDSKVYPSPAVNEINITVAKASRMEIFDAAGKLQMVRELVEGENTIDVSSLKSGMYTYRLSKDTKIGGGKFIKK